LGGILPLFYLGVLIPEFLRDALYRFIARNRYRWFGKREVCRIPTLEETHRFIDGEAVVPHSGKPQQDDDIQQADTAASIEAGLGNERLRVLLMAVFLFMAWVVYLMIAFVFCDPWSQGATADLQKGVFWPVTLIFVGGALYELLAFGFLGRLLRKSATPIPLVRAANVLLEMLIPAACLWLSAVHMDPGNGLFQPASWLFFPAILFTVLQLRFWVCAMAGAVAAMSYFWIAWLALGQVGWSLPGLSQTMTVPQHHLAKSFLLLVCGFVAGIVARQLKQQFEHTARVTFDRDRVVNLFGRHVSPQVVDQLLQQSIRVEGELRAVCVMFLDIRGFTKFSESRSAEEVMRYLNT
jgi:adenylate cyclase